MTIKYAKYYYFEQKHQYQDSNVRNDFVKCIYQHEVLWPKQAIRLVKTYLKVTLLRLS